MQRNPQFDLQHMLDGADTAFHRLHAAYYGQCEDSRQLLQSMCSAEVHDALLNTLDELARDDLTVVTPAEHPSGYILQHTKVYWLSAGAELPGAGAEPRARVYGDRDFFSPDTITQDLDKEAAAAELPDILVDVEFTAQEVFMMVGADGEPAEESKEPRERTMNLVFRGNLRRGDDFGWQIVHLHEPYETRL